MIKYLNVAEVAFINEEISRLFNKEHRIINKHLLESTIEHVQDSRYYRRFTDKAAHLLFGLVMNHCFFDGNKRTAILTTITFLEKNGYGCRDDDVQFVMALALRIASSRLKEADLRKMLSIFLKG